MDNEEKFNWHNNELDKFINGEESIYGYVSVRFCEDLKYSENEDFRKCAVLLEYLYKLDDRRMEAESNLRKAYDAMLALKKGIGKLFGTMEYHKKLALEELKEKGIDI